MLVTCHLSSVSSSASHKKDNGAGVRHISSPCPRLSADRSVSADERDISYSDFLAIFGCAHNARLWRGDNLAFARASHTRADS